MRTLRTVFAMAVLMAASTCFSAEKLKVLLIDGQNNHGWQGTTPILKWMLEDCGRFSVDVSTTPPSAPRGPQAPKADATAEQKAAYEAAKKKWDDDKAAKLKQNEDLWKNWRPKFSDYQVVVSNYNGQSWPEEVRTAFVDFVRNGGGFVAVHAADNSFPEWPEYNEMIGLGGWGGRNEKWGPYVVYRDDKLVRDEKPGSGGGHGKQHEFLVETRDAEHPITKGLPLKWKHANDELYAKLRGPAKNMTVLATAFSAPQTGGSNEHEPMLMTVAFGKGRAFHTTLGHATYSMEDIGFQATLTRGTEWAATGAVTLPAPKPEQMSADSVTKREMPKK